MRFLALVLVLSACERLSHRVEIPAPPPSLMQGCVAPTVLSGAMTQAQVEVAWGSDRRELRNCSGKQQGLADWAQSVVEVFQ